MSVGHLSHTGSNGTRTHTQTHQHTRAHTHTQAHSLKHTGWEFCKTKRNKEMIPSQSSHCLLLHFMMSASQASLQVTAEALLSTVFSGPPAGGTLRDLKCGKKKYIQFPHYILFFFLLRIFYSYILTQFISLIKRKAQQKAVRLALCLQHPTKISC